MYIYLGIMAISLIPTFISLFVAPLVGLLSIIMILGVGAILFLYMYLFQKQKDQVALFKGK